MAIMTFNLQDTPPRDALTPGGLGVRFLGAAAKREEPRSKHRRRFDLPAAPVAIQNRRPDVQRRGACDPKLPMRENSGEARAAGDSHIRRQAPKSQHVGHHRHGYEQSPAGQRQVAILSAPALDGSARVQTDANYHRLATFQNSSKKAKTCSVAGCNGSKRKWLSLMWPKRTALRAAPGNDTLRIHDPGAGPAQVRRGHVACAN